MQQNTEMRRNEWENPYLFISHKLDKFKLRLVLVLILYGIVYKHHNFRTTRCLRFLGKFGESWGKIHMARLQNQRRHFII